MADDLLHPVTIVQARYGGTYEPGVWLAFACYPNELPEMWDAGDVLASQFYAENSGSIGGGSTPTEAYENLRQLLGR